MPTRRSFAFFFTNAVGDDGNAQDGKFITGHSLSIKTLSSGKKSLLVAPSEKPALCVGKRSNEDLLTKTYLDAVKPLKEAIAEALRQAKESKVVKQGWLEKKPTNGKVPQFLRKTKKWQRRFFVLRDDGTLTYYKSRGSAGRNPLEGERMMVTNVSAGTYEAPGQQNIMLTVNSAKRGEHAHFTVRLDKSSVKHGETQHAWSEKTAWATKLAEAAGVKLDHEPLMRCRGAVPKVAGAEASSEAVPAGGDVTADSEAGGNGATLRGAAPVAAAKVEQVPAKAQQQGRNDDVALPKKIPGLQGFCEWLINGFVSGKNSIVGTWALARMLGQLKV